MTFKDLIIMLESNDLKGTIDFYENRLGFKVVGKHHSDGELTWVNLQKDKVALMFSDRFAHNQHEETFMTGSLYFYPEDVDDLWNDLKDKVKVSYPLETFHYGMREFAIYDNNGYLLQFGQEVD